MIWQQNVRVIVMLTNLVEGMRGVPGGIAPFGAGAAGAAAGAASRRGIAGSVTPTAAAAGVKCGKYWPENIGK